MSLTTSLALWSGLAFGQFEPSLVPESLLPAPIEFVVGKRWQRPSVIGQLLIVEVDRHVLITVDPELDDELQRGLVSPQAPQEVLVDGLPLLDRLLATNCGAVNVLSRPQIRTIAGERAGVQFGGQAMALAENEEAFHRDISFDFSLFPRCIVPNGVECHVNCEQVERNFLLKAGIDGEVPPGEWKRRKAGTFTMRFGDTVLVPCTESRMSQMLVFLKVRSVEP
ncbi:MAG: hypothetical protein SH850_25670 [Planctomycetaceae bacterium]|nr:hypothetical protein [Planctomycetaceae bacterium]